MNERQPKVQSLTERARENYENPQAHPFRVGETYANRQGNYEVMEIAPPKMTIRYADGVLVTADIVILARIWDNLHLPQERPELPERGRTTRRPAAQPRGTRPSE